MKPSERPTFTYLGHSTVRCDLPDGQVMVIDPWVYSNPRCPESLHDLGRIDAILITHAHADHVGDAVALAKKYQPKMVVATYELCGWLAAQGVANCAGMNLGGTQQVLGTRVTQVVAHHTSSIEIGGAEPIYGGVATGFVVTLANGFSFYHAGDTALFSDMQLIAELYRPRLAFLPIGDVYTMDPRQAAIACRFLEVREVVPIHWGTFPVLTGRPELLRHELASLGVNCEVVALEPGDTY